MDEADIHLALEALSISNTSEAAQPFRFFSLPSELRNTVYKFAFYHHENNGYIAPRLRTAKTQIKPPFRAIVNGRDSLVEMASLTASNRDDRDPDVLEYEKLRSGVRDILEYRETTQQSHFHGINITEYLESGGDPHAKIFKRTEREEDGKWSQCGYKIGHICSLACLKQPTLTMVNRQLRDEGLSYFYGTHKFQLTFPGRNRKFERSLVSWWRHTGDTNLRYINHLDIIAFSGRVLDHAVKGGLRLRKDSSCTRHALNLIEAETAQWQPEQDDDDEDDEDDESNFGEPLDGDATMKEYSDQIGMCGLFVRGIEEILGSRRWFYRRLLQVAIPGRANDASIAVDVRDDGASYTVATVDGW
ncbi:hypothetical protein LTR37_017798 [Vermiconidia calcicola]|uniref:Uncharacterized protein n=1 Tax=Vermiconidia calcicola TaxID=1690605 RepID=A0ACC3MJY8_9PEZI|nr:hypothetical protein LTR37_017798 [Vermiconidia calcicola]